jgi:hypothetical protein
MKRLAKLSRVDRLYHHSVSRLKFGFGMMPGSQKVRGSSPLSSICCKSLPNRYLRLPAEAWQRGAKRVTTLLGIPQCVRKPKRNPVGSKNSADIESPRRSEFKCKRNARVWTEAIIGNTVRIPDLRSMCRSSRTEKPSTLKLLNRLELSFG